MREYKIEEKNGKFYVYHKSKSMWLAITYPKKYYIEDKDGNKSPFETRAEAEVYVDYLVNMGKPLL